MAMNCNQFTPKKLATLLAIGGVLWGVVLLLMFGPAALFPVPFGIGYLVTAGYIFRACHDANGIRSWIWGLSAAVQGTWLAIFTLFTLAGSAEPGSIIILMPWWIASFAGSIWAFGNDLDYDLHEWHTHNANAVDQRTEEPTNKEMHRSSGDSSTLHKLLTPGTR